MNRHERDDRKIRRSFRHKKHVLIVILAAVLLAGAGFLISKTIISPQEEQKAFEKNYFKDSKYAGISSKIIERESAREDVFLEYPVTKSDKINAEIERKVVELDEDFKQNLAQNSDFKEKKSHKMSYQVFWTEGNLLSLEISSHQENHGAHPENRNFFWTFDVNSGEALRLSNFIFEEKRADFLKLAREKISKILTEKKIEFTEADLANLDFADFENFATLDKKRLSFPFGAAQILSNNFGEISLEFEAVELTMIFSDAAHKIWDFQVPVSEPEKDESASEGNSKNASVSTISSGEKCQNCVALTFDDGPRLGQTDRLLDFLKAKNTRATFFTLGPNIERNPALVARAAREGHEIGNHTWTHSEMTKLSAAQIQDEVSKTNDAIFRATGKRANLLRQPYGATNSAVQAELGKLGMSSILWSVDTRDWADRNSEIVCNRAVSSARSGSIILLHDIHATSVDAVPCILDGISKKGLKFATVSQVLGTVEAGKIYYSGN